ncbi:hypothetical protein CEXT_234051 [Caerostris extrusa]|uniref:Uncharacterized protein n=1 Tax=Caerostris extrusa TaxID=172846 RepID=A0AAV4X0B2_CAEEX|nr:hypothetical protein CEXT_234051 [Caerostris extrusa]
MDNVLEFLTKGVEFEIRPLIGLEKEENRSLNPQMLLLTFILAPNQTKARDKSSIPLMECAAITALKKDS